MMDGSLEADGKSPASFEYNCEITKKVVDAAHAKGVSVEGELGCLGSLETGMGEKEDGHGAYKFTNKPTGEVLAISRIAEIHDKLPNTHLVMHGSSSVPQELQDIINKYGGAMKQTYGVPVEEIQEGIKHGVRKINVDTDNRMAITGAIRKVFTEGPAEFDPRKYLGPARAAMQDVCKARMEAFGQAGNASKIKCISIVDMAKSYAG